MPKVRKGAKRKVLERKIHFYRAYCGQDESGKPLAYKQGSALAHIDSLPFTDHKQGGRYFEDSDNVYCCWVVDPNKIRFAVIRRDAFPQIEEQGIVKALNVPAAAGLVEQIHVRFFPKNIVGFDANFYGPRLPRLGRYINQVAAGQGAQVNFNPLLRQDAVNELSGKDLRIFSMRIKRSEIDMVKQTYGTLGEAFEATDKVGQADEVQIVLRPKPYSRDSIGKKLMDATKKLAKRSDIGQIASEFKVDVIEPGKASQTVDLLGDHFIADRRILRQSDKGRALDANDAFAKIEEAHGERKQELEKAASLAL